MLDVAQYGLYGCVAAIALVVILSIGRAKSVGLPIAYMIALGLIHIPGGVAYVASEGAYSGVLAGGDYAAIGIALTAVGMWSFAFGLALVRLTTNKNKLLARVRENTALPPRFAYFCLAAGWLAAFAATPLTTVPTLGAAIVFGSAIWVLGVIIGLRRAADIKDVRSSILWFAAMLVYPVVVLTFGGFLSYGSTVVIVVLSSLLVRFRRASTALMILPLAAFLAITLFVNYFEDRSRLREVVWSDAGVTERASAVLETFSGFRLFDIDDPAHLNALSERLNQNELVGLSYERLQDGQVQYLHGRSFYEGAISVIPRAIWPDKPVHGGSPVIVSEMTGLQLSTNTSWGVGNVMEFYINYGFFSLITAFVALGVCLGWLDRMASNALQGRYYASTILYFLPGVALIQPNGSMVELTGGAFAALLAAHFWLFVWRNFFESKVTLRPNNSAPANKYRS